MGLFSLVVCNRLPLLLWVTSVVLSYILAGRLYGNRSTLFLAGQNTRVYASGHCDTILAGMKPRGVYNSDQLCSFRRQSIIEPVTAATVGELGLRGRSHRTRDRHADARIQLRITTLSRGVNIKPRHGSDPLQPQQLAASVHGTGSCLLTLSSSSTAGPNNMTPRTQRHTYPTVRRLKCEIGRAHV